MDGRVKIEVEMMRDDDLDLKRGRSARVDVGRG